MKGIKGIKKKIVLNYCIIIFITIFVLETFFIINLRNYYYNSASNFLLNKAKSSTEFYNKYMIYDSFEDKIRHIYKNIILNEKEVGVEVIGKNKRVLINAQGFQTYKINSSLDVLRGLKGESIVNSQYDESSKEKIMSISIPLRYYDRIDGVLRYSISLKSIDKTLFMIEAVAIISGLFVSSFVLLVSLILARSIINPITLLKGAANEMAKGNYKIRSLKISNDEIGELSQTFNHMAEEIERSEKLKNEFISSVSHELRTPLTSIKGWSETLEQDLDKAEFDIGIGIINSETDRLIRLVEELLDFSKYSSQNIELHYSNTNINELLTEVINQFKVKIKDKAIDVSLQLPQIEITSLCDASRMRQVFINLVENCIKFSKENAYMYIALTADNNNIQVIVSDNGIGIEEGNLHKIMDKFYQEDYNKSGSGLGLAICNEIIKAHGGAMEIDSKKNLGTTVKIIMPRRND